MIVKRFGCTAIHKKALYKCIIHSFIQFVMVLLIYNENCIGFNGNCNGACWSLLVIGRLK